MIDIKDLLSKLKQTFNFETIGYVDPANNPALLEKLFEECFEEAADKQPNVLAVYAQIAALPEGSDDSALLEQLKQAKGSLVSGLKQHYADNPKEKEQLLESLFKGSIAFDHFLKDFSGESSTVGLVLPKLLHFFKMSCSLSGTQEVVSSSGQGSLQKFVVQKQKDQARISACIEKVLGAEFVPFFDAQMLTDSEGWLRDEKVNDLLLAQLNLFLEIEGIFSSSDLVDSDRLLVNNLFVLPVITKEIFKFWKEKIQYLKERSVLAQTPASTATTSSARAKVQERLASKMQQAAVKKTPINERDFLEVPVKILEQLISYYEKTGKADRLHVESTEDGPNDRAYYNELYLLYLDLIELDQKFWPEQQEADQKRLNDFLGRALFAQAGVSWLLIEKFKSPEFVRPLLAVLSQERKYLELEKNYQNLIANHGVVGLYEGYYQFLLTQESAQALPGFVLLFKHAPADATLVKSQCLMKVLSAQLDSKDLLLQVSKDRNFLQHLWSELRAQAAKLLDGAVPGTYLAWSQFQSSDQGKVLRETVRSVQALFQLLMIGDLQEAEKHMLCFQRFDFLQQVLMVQRHFNVDFFDVAEQLSHLPIPKEIENERYVGMLSTRGNRNNVFDKMLKSSEAGGKKGDFNYLKDYLGRMKKKLKDWSLTDEDFYRFSDGLLYALQKHNPDPKFKEECDRYLLLEMPSVPVDILTRERRTILLLENAAAGKDWALKKLRERANRPANEQDLQFAFPADLSCAQALDSVVKKFDPINFLTALSLLDNIPAHVYIRTFCATLINLPDDQEHRDYGRLSRLKQNFEAPLVRRSTVTGRGSNASGSGWAPGQFPLPPNNPAVLGPSGVAPAPGNKN